MARLIPKVAKNVSFTVYDSIHDILDKLNSQVKELLLIYLHNIIATPLWLQTMEQQNKWTYEPATPTGDRNISF